MVLAVLYGNRKVPAYAMPSVDFHKICLQHEKKALRTVTTSTGFRFDNAQKTFVGRATPDRLGEIA